MPIQSTDTTTTITVGSDSETWVIKSGVEVATSTYGVSDDHSRNVIANYGHITAEIGVRLSTGLDSQMFNESTGIIDAKAEGVYATQDRFNLDNRGIISAGTYAVLNYGSNTHLNNSGLISGGYCGVGQAAADGGDLINSGTITATAGILLFIVSGQTSRIDNSGLIHGHQVGIGDASGSAGGLALDNTGRIEGAVAMAAATTLCSVVNSGAIIGDVALGSLADTYDGRGGSVSGIVYGGAGNDSLTGGLGDDALNGGTGRDRLDGGKGGGEDRFVFDATMDSPRNAPDVISRHWTAADIFDLSGIDPDRHHAGDQGFAFRGLINPGDPVAARSVEYFHQNGDTYVVADVNGDGQADFEVIIRGAVTLNAGQFVL